MECFDPYIYILMNELRGSWISSAFDILLFLFLPEGSVGRRLQNRKAANYLCN